MSFLNPYHFVPVDCQRSEKAIACPKGIPLSREVLGHCTFDRYHENTHSGRIECTLRTVSPIVVGKKQCERTDDYTVVEPFERSGKPAIPASTLRGCLSSLAEAVSNSALRVLDDVFYSIRVNVGEKKSQDFSAMGMIVEEKGQLRLRPLVMPTLTKNIAVPHFTLPLEYRKMFPAPAEDSIFSPELRFKAYCFELEDLQTGLQEYSPNKTTFYYAVLCGTYTMNSDHQLTGSGGKTKTTRNENIFLGLTTMEDPNKINEGESERGILRILSDPHNREDMPRTKTHELFIPYPDNIETSPTFPINSDALAEFYRIASGREQENKRRKSANRNRQDLLPYCPRGIEPFNTREPPYGLKDGDIVFFTPDATGDEVAKVWVSQVWREEVPCSSHDFFRDINKELVPFNRERETITPAEAIFGFVEIDDKEDVNETKIRNHATTSDDESKTNRKDLQKPPARALASRIRFSEGSLVVAPASGCYHETTNLRILASPKPPCPSFYFRKKSLSNTPSSSDCYISKKELQKKNIESFSPQGRKFYLNQAMGTDSLEKCRTNNENFKKQKNQVKPVKAGCAFTFHIDFDNLSDWELGLLLYTIEPSTDFHHKIGMGKSLGLGSVKMEIAGIFYIDRKKRYSVDGFLDTQGKFCPRYHDYWIGNESEDVGRFFDPDEKNAMLYQKLPDNNKKAPNTLKKQFIDSMIPNIKKGIDKIGRPGQQQVTPPLTQIQTNNAQQETETYKWFVQNDRGNNHQGLVPLEYGDGISRLEHN
jgi:CRISPR-associated protein (TIGR03986 family)